MNASLEKIASLPLVRILAATALVWVAVFGFFGRLAVGERSDPLFEAETLISQGRWQEALRALDQLRGTVGEPWADQQVRLQKALAFKELGRPRQSLELLDAVRSQTEWGREIDDYVAFWKAECYVALELPDSAVAAYADVRDAEPVSLLKDAASVRSARLHADAGSHKEAAESYRHLLGTSLYDVEALVGTRAAQVASGDSAAGRKTAFQLIRDYPGRNEALAVLETLRPLRTTRERFYGGVCYARHGRTRDAVRIFKTVIQEESAPLWRGRAQYEMGVAYFNRKDYRTAERVLDRAYTIYRVPKALYQLGRCSVKRGRDKEAIKRFIRFADQYPGTSDAAESLWNAAMAFERQGRFDRSRELFLKLAARHPGSDFADKGRWRAGYALFRTGEYEEAAESFLRLAENTSEVYLRDQGYYWAGKCLLKTGRDSAAVDLWREAARGFPLSYYSTRARAALGEGSPESALPKGRGASGEEGYQPSISMQKGDLLASLGAYRQAESEYRRAEWLHRTSLFALADLQQRYERLGAMDRALSLSYRMMEFEQQRGVPVTMASFRRLYPTYYWGEIRRSAEAQKVDPNLVLAIIRQESSFNEEALSPVGARGLMQVMPATGRHLARRMRLREYSAEDLWNPRTSIRLGTAHLSDHLKSFDEEDDRGLSLALSAYNAGMRVARRWSRRLSDDDVDEFVESIPYRETRNYVKLVYRNYQVYSYLQSEAELATLVQ